MFLPDQPPTWPKRTNCLPPHGSQPFHWPWPPPRLLRSRAGQSQREWWLPQSPHLPKTRASTCPHPQACPLGNLGMPCLCHSSSYRVFCPCCSSCLRLTSTFLCALRPQGSWWLPGLSSSTACGLKKAITSPCPRAQLSKHIGKQRHAAPGPKAPCSHLYLSVSALKSPPEFHEQRKHLDSDKVNSCKPPIFLIADSRLWTSRC